MNHRDSTLVGLCTVLGGAAFRLRVWVDGIGVWWLDPRTGARGLHHVDGARARALSTHRRNARRRFYHSHGFNGGWSHLLPRVSPAQAHRALLLRLLSNNNAAAYHGAIR